MRTRIRGTSNDFARRGIQAARERGGSFHLLIFNYRPERSGSLEVEVQGAAQLGSEDIREFKEAAGQLDALLGRCREQLKSFSKEALESPRKQNYTQAAQRMSGELAWMLARLGDDTALSPDKG